MENLPATNEAKGNQEIQLVTFGLGGEEYGVEVLKVREIIRPPQVTKMPNTESCVDGIINLRGKVIPIISMRDKFGLERTDNNSSTRIMVIDVENELIGFFVDSVSEVIRINESIVQPPPPVISSDVAQEYITGICQHHDNLIVLLSLDKLFTSEEKEDILQKQ